MSIRILLADDQAMVRAGFRMILEAEADLEVVGEADDGIAAVAAASQLLPDLTLMDIQMPIMDGLEATRRIVGIEGQANARVVILTMFERDDYIFEALRVGASGFLLKNAPADDLIKAVRVVAAGDALLAPSVTRRIIAHYARQPEKTARAAELSALTDREREVLCLLATGKSNVEIAAELHVGEGTVKTHVSHLLHKLGLRDRVQAVVFAYQSGIMEHRDEP
jgi:DNA-binding NarL/FixJ family response regulator